MKKLIKFTKLSLLLLLLTACKTSINKEPNLDELEDKKIESITEEKNKMEIRVSCGKGSIKEFINDGWIVVKEYSEEKICTWKSVPATKDCDMEKDKGCKITKPDEIGEEKIYLLEK